MKFIPEDVDFLVKGDFERERCRTMQHVAFL